MFLGKVSKQSNFGTEQLILLLVVLMPLLTALGFVVAPSVIVLFQWLGLCAPFFIFLNFIVLLGCLVLRRRYYLIIVLSLINCICFIPFFLQWNTSSTSPEKIDLRVGSYNVRGMKGEYGFSTLSNLVDFSQKNQLDVLFLQEVPFDYQEDDLLEEFSDMRYVMFSNDGTSSGKRLAILSKYSLSAYKNLSYDDYSQYAMFATLTLPNEKLMLVNCHLNTTNWNQLKRSKASIISGGYQVMSDNSKRRELQALKIREVMNNTSYPLVVAGDFNEPPVSFSYHTIGGSLKDAFREAGNGYSYTYRYLSKLFRIDYIFYAGDRLEGYNYRTEELNYSDHLPVMVDLVLKDI